MDIRLIRFKGKYFNSVDEKEDKRFIEEINDTLFDDDCALKDDAPNALLTVLFVESDGIEDQYQSFDFSSINPLIILVGKHPRALKGALELNSYLILRDYDPLLINGKEASLLLELHKVMLLKSKLSGSSLGAFGTFKKNDQNDVEDLEKKFDLHIIHFSRKKFLDIYFETEPSDIPSSNVIRKYITSEEEFDEFKKLYHTINYFVINYDLKAIAFDLKGFNCYTSLLASLFIDRGVSFIVDNDLTSLISLYALNSISETNAMYASLSKMEFTKNKISLIISNPPLNILNSEQGLLKGNITLCKIALNHRHLFSFNGKIIDSSLIDRYSYLVNVEIEGRELFPLFNEPLGGTLAFSYGDYIGNLLAFDNIISLNEKD